MRKRATADGLSVVAIAGTHAVFLAFDLSDPARAGCLGFAIQRTDHTEQEQYWLAGFKTFKSVVPQPVGTTTYPTDQHPIQGMWWGDYSAKPAHRYSYEVVPVYGTPAAPQVDNARSVTLQVQTDDPDTGTHGVYFNRGVAASQAYATKFGKPPHALPAAEQALAMTWLSRGLYEAMHAFITSGAGPELVLRAAVYEFTEPTILKAFADAHRAGADVKIVYHAVPQDPQTALNEAAIASAVQDAGFDRAMLLPRTHATIAHNKFIVRGTRQGTGAPLARQVWTGSTNLSEGGIYGHSNVGHVVRNESIAGHYLEYWDELAGDPVHADLAAWVAAQNPFASAAVAASGRRAVFSPRPQLDPLAWYAATFADPHRTGHITLPFGMDNTHFEPALAQLAPDGPLRYVMLNKQDDHQDTWSADHSVVVAVGAEGGPDLLLEWAQESLTGFNPHVPYLHTKILLAGVLEQVPTVISGSANFSTNSTTANDENMLVIVGDRAVADVYFTEYMRIFDHFYARWWARKLHTAAADTETHSFLSEDDSWQAPYWNPGSPKARQRELFAGAYVAPN